LLFRNEIIYYQISEINAKTVFDLWLVQQSGDSSTLFMIVSVFVNCMGIRIQTRCSQMAKLSQM